MSAPNPILSTIIFVFALQAIALSILLLTKKPRKQSNLFLALLVLFFALMALNIALINVLIGQDAFHIFRFVQLELLFGIGPALFFYTRSVTNSSFQFSRKDLWHFLPVVVEFIFYRTPLYRLGADGMYTTPNHPYTKLYLTEQWLGILSITIYTLLALRLLYLHQVMLKQHYSNIADRSMSWLKAPVIIYSGYWIFWNILTEIDRFAFDRTLREIYFLPTFAGLAVVSCWVGFKGYLKSQSPSLPSPSTSHESLTRVKTEWGRRIATLMEQERPYLDPDLDLHTLSSLLKLTPKQVSSTLNQHFNQNFYEYVNQFRVEAFKARVSEPDSHKLTLLGHAFESGFKSKSTFNHVFKKAVGKTPSAFVKNLKNKSE